MDSVSNKMAKGAAWMVGFKIVERSIGLVSTIILARLLEPGDFGLVAMSTAFLSLLMLLTGFSFDVALIQKQNADRLLYDTAWTFNVIFGVFLAIALVLAAIPLAQFYNEGRLENILYVLALSTFLSGFGNIGPVAFRKDLQFHKEFYFLLAKKMMGFGVCMVLAFALRNYWALVWGTFAGRVLEVLLSYLVHPYRPRFCLKGRKELFGFSMWMFVNSIIYFIYHSLADFIISKVFGSHTLGVYSVAYELSNLPTTELVAPINRAVLPGYSKMSGDPDALRQGFLNVLSIIALCAVPAGVGIALVADPMVSVILGDKWQESIPLIKVLALSGTLMALQTNASVVYNSLGKPKYVTAIFSFHVFIIFLPMLFFFLQQEGLLGVAKAYLFSNLIILPINYYIAIKLVKLKFIVVALAAWRPLCSACVMFFAVPNFIAGLSSVGLVFNDIGLLAISIVLGAITYGFMDMGLWVISQSPDGAEKILLKKLKVIT